MEDKNGCKTGWVKEFALGFNFCLRQKKQEAFNSKIIAYLALKDTDNKLQSFGIFGLVICCK